MTGRENLSAMRSLIRQSLRKETLTKIKKAKADQKDRVREPDTDGLVIGSQTSIGDLSHIIESTEFEALE